MTILVGIANGKNVYIGADRAASDGDTIITMYRPKVHTNNKWIFAYSGSIGTGQLIELIDFPHIDKKSDVYRLIKTDIVKKLKEFINEYSKEGEDTHTDFLIGANGRLFELSTEDWGVVEVTETCAGSGNQISLGSLYTTYMMDMDIEDRIRMALDSAIEYSPSCQGPVDILYV